MMAECGRRFRELIDWFYTLLYRWYIRGSAVAVETMGVIHGTTNSAVCDKIHEIRDTDHLHHFQLDRSTIYSITIRTIM